MKSALAVGTVIVAKLIVNAVNDWLMEYAMLAVAGEPENALMFTAYGTDATDELNVIPHCPIEILLAEHAYKLPL